MKKDIFKQKPQLIEFARIKTYHDKDDDIDDEDDKLKKRKKKQEISVIDFSIKKKQKEVSKLVWGRPNFGIYDRYGTGASNLDTCWAFSGPGFEKNIPTTFNLDYRGNSTFNIVTSNAKSI